MSPTPSDIQLALLQNKMSTALVTVGSTKFESLIHKILTPPFLKLLHTHHNIRTLIIQYGNGKHTPPPDKTTVSGIKIVSYAYKPTLAEDLEKADLVISHAGAGSIIESLGRSKQLVVVVNRELMDDHQKELADLVEERSYAYKADVDSLEGVLERADFGTRVGFPERNRGAVGTVLLQEVIE